MIVEVVGYTQFVPAAAETAGYIPHTGFNTPTDADELGEFAGRLCYQSFDRPNPATAKNDGYIKNILEMGHESVLEHSSVSFYVAGVSRSLLAELTRHRHLSFSVLSQRYVRQTRDQFVVPKGIEENAVLDCAEEDWILPLYVQEAFEDAIDYTFGAYDRLANALITAGLPKKRAMEAARSVLPQATETRMVVTGNLRAWRDVLKKRYHVAADREIQALADELLKKLRVIAPASFSDLPEEMYGTETG